MLKGFTTPKILIIFGSLIALFGIGLMAGTIGAW